MDSHRRGRNHANMVCLVGEMKKEDEKRKMEEVHQRRVNQMIKSAEGSAGLLHKFSVDEHRSWRKKKRMPDCWTAVKQRGKMGKVFAV